MKILYVIALLSFAALAWAAVAIARHIKRGDSQAGAPTPASPDLTPISPVHASRDVTADSVPGSAPRHSS